MARQNGSQNSPRHRPLPQGITWIWPCTAPPMSPQELETQSKRVFRIRPDHWSGPGPTRFWVTGVALHRPGPKPVFLKTGLPNNIGTPPNRFAVRYHTQRAKISLFRRTDARFVKDFEFSINFSGFWPGCRARTWIVQEHAPAPIHRNT